MLNFDLRDTVAGQQIFEAGIEEGILNGILTEARDMVIEVLTERFVAVPPEIQELVYSVGDHKILKELLRYAVRSPKMEDFRNILSKVSLVSNGKEVAEASV